MKKKKIYCFKCGTEIQRIYLNKFEWEDRCKCELQAKWGYNETA